MLNPWDQLKLEISKQVKTITKADVFDLIEEPTILGRGDLSLPCFALSKQFPASPQEIAEDLGSKIKSKYFSKVDVIGPYVNFHVDWNQFTKTFLGKIDSKYGKTNYGKKQKVMIEFSNANTNKPLHIGHARNCVLGSSLANIMTAAGFNVIKTDYTGDIGLHIAKTIYAYDHWAKKKKPSEKPDHYIGDLYVMFSQKMEKDPELEEKAREVLRLWEDGDKKTRETWKKLNKWAVEGQQETFKRYGIKFDVRFSESQFDKSGKEFVNKLLKQGDAFKGDEGQIVANLEKYGIPNMVLLRSDGTSLYVTKEFALIDTKFKKYNPSQSINVVAREHELYFQQVFKLMELLKHKAGGKSHHLSYGLVMLPEGKMSGRKGEAIYIDNLIDDIKADVLKLIIKKFPKKKAEEVAEKVALSAIKYSLIKMSPERNVMFNKKEITRYEGDTGPYLQYTYARASSILSKAGTKKGKTDVSLLTDPREITIIKLLAKYPSIVDKAARELRPHYIANYLYTLAENFNNFYQNVPVLKGEEKLKLARLKLIQATKTTIGNGLGLLGISSLEKM